MLKATLAFDFQPLTSDVSKSADYTSVTLYSAISAQLFRWYDSEGHLVPAACSSAYCSPDATEYRLSLAAGLSWPDGAPVAAAQYADRIREVVTSRCPIGTRFSGLVAIDGQSQKRANGLDEEVIRIKLAAPDNQLKNKLAHASLGPLRSKNSSEIYPDAAGPFSFDTLNEAGATLRRRYSRETGPKGFDWLNIRFIIDPEEAISLYMKGEIDSTCPVSFPLERVAEFANHDEFFRCPTTTFFVIIPITDRAHTRQFRHAIRESINMDAIMAVAPAGLSSWRTFIPLAPDRGERTSEVLPGRGERLETSFILHHSRISLAVDNFEPNLKIAFEIADQLSKRGCKVDVIVDSFEKPVAKCDLRLCVLSNSRSYQVDLYRRLSHSRVIRSDAALNERYTSLIDDFDGAWSDAERSDIISELDDIIAEEMPVIPIACLGQFYLKRKSLKRFDWGGDASWMIL
ncbi:ABC transporter substrate-binding protein [Rhizobium ruizarguesonis]